MSSMKGANIKKKKDEKQLSHFFPRTNMGALNKKPMSLSTIETVENLSQITKSKENHSLIAQLDTTFILPYMHCLIALLRKAKVWSCH